MQKKRNLYNSNCKDFIHSIMNDSYTTKITKESNRGVY